MNDLNLIIQIENKVKSGVYLSDNEINYMNMVSINLLETPNLSEEELDIVEHIIIISDILYNNTDRNILPLDDGIYDKLVELYKSKRPFFVHADPVYFDNTESNNNGIVKDMIDPFIFLEDINKDEDSLFIDNDNLLKEIPSNQFIPMNYNVIEEEKTHSKINREVPHEYPQLVGTLDKCKFTLNKEAYERGVIEDPTVKVFERDFIGMHIEAGYVDPLNNISLIAELKYDGVSIEATVTNKIISARSRGDTDNNIAADYTPIFYGMEFPYAPKEMENQEPFGMKFEAIITKDNLMRLNQLRGTNYVNCRVAIIGLLNSSDAYRYRNFITLIPLATSLDIPDRITELEFMNKYYNMGELNRYSVIHGTIQNAIYQVYRFVKEAELIRPLINYLYDGVVISYLDPYLRNILGRVGAINKYTIAIKFSPMNKQTIFNGYSFTVGQNGVVTPLLHYKPIEFYGFIHTKSSGHSYGRFKELGLRVGDIISVEYTNDVMPYATKIDCTENDNNPNPIIQFPTKCPSCGSDLVFTEKSAICKNRNCPERVYNRMANMIKILGIKDFSVERIKSLRVSNLIELAKIPMDNLISILGEVNGTKLFNRIHDTLYNKKIKDYVLVSSLGYENISTLTWKKILTKLNFINFCKYILNNNSIGLYNELIQIKGIGSATAETISYTSCECEDVKSDLMFILSLIESGYVEISYSPLEKEYIAQVRFTGIRDPELELELSEAGYDCSGTASVTKKTDILIVPYSGFESSKTAKLRIGAVVMPIEEVRYRLLGKV